MLPQRRRKGIILRIHSPPPECPIRFYHLPILEALAEAEEHGFTDEELVLHTGRGSSDISSRRKELQKAGMVQDSGDKRPTSRKRQAIIWIITPLGRETFRKLKEEKSHVSR